MVEIGDKVKIIDDLRVDGPMDKPPGIVHGMEEYAGCVATIMEIDAYGVRLDIDDGDFNWNVDWFVNIDDLPETLVVNGVEYERKEIEQTVGNRIVFRRPELDEPIHIYTNVYEYSPSKPGVYLRAKHKIVDERSNRDDVALVCYFGGDIRYIRLCHGEESIIGLKPDCPTGLYFYPVYFL